jgi:hypothetical protein
MTTAAGAMADVRDMYLTHIMLRREFSRAPTLVRGVPEGDVKRAAVISGHIAVICTILHAHHGGEDALLWPKLLERGPAEITSVVQVMEGHHESIEQADREIKAALTGWRRDASFPHREALAAALDRLIPALVEHTALEEEHILPLAEKYVTAAEWQELGAHAMSELPKKQLPLAIGMAMYEGDPEAVKAVLAEAPLIARILMPVLGPRAYASHAKRVHGTATPTRSAA